MILNQSDYSPLALAYLGDSYYETIAREYLIADGNVKLSVLNTRAKEIVTAAAQASIASRMMPLLNEEEMAVFKAGRNAKTPHRSRSATAIEYRFATGLECLYGYFCLNGSYERAKSLFMKCIKEVQTDE